MRKYLPATAIVAGMIGGIYAILLIAATAAPAPSASGQASQSSLVADHLKADAALLAHPGLKATEPAPQAP